MKVIAVDLFTTATVVHRATPVMLAGGPTSPLQRLV
jgi:hypothetical protein